MIQVRLQRVGRLLTAAIVAFAFATLTSGAEKAAPDKAGAGKAQAKPAAAKPDKSKERAESLGKIVSHLGLGKGAAIADIGAGGGPDTWAFAGLVGPTGTVFSQEVTEGKVQSLKKDAEKRGLPQVRAVLGRGDDPCLPADSVDMAYLHTVYHHFAKPREMLRGIWRSLKPGGYLVVVDRERGTLRDWAPENVRADSHHWTGETTVVRLAREAGFLFAECAEDYWHDKEQFVFVFQRPKGVKEPGHDPDSFLPVSVEQSRRLFLPVGPRYQRPVFVALGPSRELIPSILNASSGPGLEIVLEEWATQKEERPALPSQVSLPSVFTEKGDPRLGPEPIDVVFFLDSYHLLFHGGALLPKLHQRLSAGGCVYVLDREAKEPLPRRDASHKRKITREMVTQEMAKAGFHLWFCGPRPAGDRLLLVFGKTPAAELSPERDPFVGGPEISDPPGDWLKQNLWRLRGLKTADGKFVPLGTGDREGTVQAIPASTAGEQTWRLTKSKLALVFVKVGEKYVLESCSTGP